MSVNSTQKSHEGRFHDPHLAEKHTEHRVILCPHASQQRSSRLGPPHGVCLSLACGQLDKYSCHPPPICSFSYPASTPVQKYQMENSRNKNSSVFNHSERHDEVLGPKHKSSLRPVLIHYLPESLSSRFHYQMDCSGVRGQMSK